MLPIIASIVSGLIQNNLPKVADAVLEKGVDYVQDKMGIQLKPEGEATKEDYAKLQEAAMKHEEFMVEADLKNMEGARNMQLKAMDSDDPLVRRFVYYFITFWSILSASYVGAITFATIPEANIRFADTILGFVLGTMVAAMFQFLLGSSLGSRKKDEAKK
jgi:MoaA/NifB/PqqE/SkfB family radical SAM enzyme